MVGYCRFFVFFALALMGSFSVQAADFSMRVGDHQDRVRLVIETRDGVIPPYKIKTIDDQTVEVSFDAPGHLMGLTRNDATPEITDVRTVSNDGQNLRLWVMQGARLYQRDLQVGGRLILDFAQSKELRTKAERSANAAKADPAAAAKLPAISAPTPGVASTAVATVPAPKIDEPKVTVPKVEEPKLVVAMPAPAAPTKTTLTIDRTDPPVVTLSAISKFGMAVFVQDGTLWMVVDQPDFVGTPKITGKGAASFGVLSRRVTKDATIFRIQMPNGVTERHAEGGDLLWRVVLGAKATDALPTEPERMEEKNARSVIWPLKGVSKLLAVDDPATGDTLRVVTVEKSNTYTGPARRFAEFQTAESLAGLAVIPRVDDLNITTVKEGVAITRADGLSTTTALEAQSYKPATALAPPPTATETHDTAKDIKDAATTPSDAVEVKSNGATSHEPLFRFKRWAMGGTNSLLDNEAALVADLAEKAPEARASGLMDIGKMYLSNGRGSEALGYFQLAAESQPGLVDSAEFKGLTGTAYAMNGQFDEAYDNLRDPGLDIYPDANLWRAYVLANLQDWQQAAATLGSDYSWVQDYPASFGAPMMLTFSEIALRAGHAAEAQKILASVAPASGTTDLPKTDSRRIAFEAARAYLQGESARQLGNKDEARKAWQDLSKSRDDKYRARARLAMTVLDYEDGKINQDQAIDQLENLRYAWRGDELEAAIGARLGDIYIAHGDYVRGLSVMRDAATLDPSSEIGRRITANMTDIFKSLYTTDNMKKIDPIDAITVFEKFSELIPTGDESNRMTMNLIDRLMEVDLLDRATVMLQDLVDHKLQGDDRIGAALRLAAVHLMNHRPDLALGALNRVDAMFATLSDPAQVKKRRDEQMLLKARALYMSDRADQALSMLDTLGTYPDALRAKADIAWQTARWSSAAQALETLLSLSPPSPNKPPTPEQAELVRNLAVATNLSGDRSRLAVLRNQYDQVMKQSALANEFDVITRERQTPTLADRDTMNNLVSEVDLFGGFLNGYRKSVTTQTDIKADKGGAPINESPAPNVNPASSDPVTEGAN